MPYSLTVDPRISLTRPVPILVPRSPSPPSSDVARSPYRRYSPTSDGPGNRLQTLSPDRRHHHTSSLQDEPTHLIELWFSDLFGDDPLEPANMQVDSSKHRPAPLDLRTSYDGGNPEHRDRTEAQHPAQTSPRRSSAASQPVSISRQYSSSSGQTPMLTHSTSSGGSSSAASTTTLPTFPYHAQQQQHYSMSPYQSSPSMMAPAPSSYDQQQQDANGLAAASYRPTLHHFSTAPSAPYSFNRSSSYLKSPPMPHGLEAYHSRSYGPPAASGASGFSGASLSAGGPAYAPYGAASAAARAALQDRPYKCDECVQSFNRNHDLKRHKRIHLSIKPFACDKCGKQFSRKDALRRHWLVKGCRGDESPSTMSNPLFQRGSNGAAQPPALSPSSPDEPSSNGASGRSASFATAASGSRNNSQSSLMRTPSTSGPVIVTPSDESAGNAYARHYASYGGYPSSAPTSSSFGYHPSFPLSASSSSGSLHSNNGQQQQQQGNSSSSPLPPLPSPHLSVGIYSSASNPYGTLSSTAATTENSTYGNGNGWQQNAAAQQQHRYSIAASSGGRVDSISSQVGTKDEVLVVQPDGMIEANITETGPQGQVRTRRESRDYFAGVFPDNATASKQQHQPTHGGLAAPSSAPPIFAMPFEKGVHITRSDSASSSNDGMSQQDQQQQQAQNWQRW